LTLSSTLLGLRLVSLVPVALAFVEVFWTLALLGSETTLQTRELDAVGMIPGLLGVLAAIVIPFLYRLKWFEYLALVAGALLCLPLVIAFGSEWLAQ
jgi:hypothetical protein